MLVRTLSFMTAALVATHASAHLHINMGADSTSEDTPLAISFYGSETFAITDTGDRLEFQEGGSILTLTTDTLVGAQYNALVSGLEGTRRAAMPNFTVDGSTQEVVNLNTPAGRSTEPAAPFGYEIVSVVATDGDQPLNADYAVIWRHFTYHGGHLGLPSSFSGYETFAADSSGDDVIERAYLIAHGTHSHGGVDADSGFFLFTDAPVGEYDISIRAIDAGGYFAASEAVTFRLSVVPEPTTLALLGLGGAAMAWRRRRA